MSLREMIELLISLGAGDKELREGIDLYDRLSTGPQERPAAEAAPITVPPPNGKRPARPSKNGSAPVGHSTRNASILPLQDWVTVEQAARACGVSEKEIRRIVRVHGLTEIEFEKAPSLVHQRQIAYWLEHKEVLTVNPDVFDGWIRQAEAARQCGVLADVIVRLADHGEIARFRPTPKLVLVNEREVARKVQGARHD